MNKQEEKQIVFFRDHSKFCLEVSKKLKESNANLIEIILNPFYHEKPCIVSSSYTNFFQGEVGICDFVSKIT